MSVRLRKDDWYSYNDGVWLKFLCSANFGKTFVCSERIVDNIHSVIKTNYRMDPIIKRANHYQIEHDSKAMLALGQYLKKEEQEAIEFHEYSHKAFWKEKRSVGIDLETDLSLSGLSAEDLIHYATTLGIMPLDTSGSLSLQKVEPKLHLALAKHLI